MRSGPAEDHSPVDADASAFPRSLVVVRAGRDSLHPSWLDADRRARFDLLVARYEPGPSVGDRPGHMEVAIPGAKVAGYADLFRARPELLEEYDFIALFDDDLSISAREIERLFEVGATYGLDLFQPSLSWTSYFTYAAFLNSPGVRLRFANFIEMMCPVFRASYLRKALPLFALGFETGIDLVWCRLAGRREGRFAIVDDVLATHTRPVGATKHRQGFAPGESYDAQIAMVLGRFAADFRGTVTYAAIDLRGRRTSSRLLLGIRSLRLWRALRRTPMSKWHYARFVSDYTRHCLTRPLNLDRINLDPFLMIPAGPGDVINLATGQQR